MVLSYNSAWIFDFGGVYSPQPACVVLFGIEICIASLRCSYEANGHLGLVQRKSH